MSNQNISTDDVLEMLAEHGNPRVGRTRNCDMASPLNGRDPDGVNWTVEVGLLGYHNDSGGEKMIVAGSNSSAKEAASAALDRLYEFMESDEAKACRERYLKHFTTNAEMWIKKPGGYYHGDFGPKSKPRYERVKNDPCPEPTDLLIRLGETWDR